MLNIFSSRPKPWLLSSLSLAQAHIHHNIRLFSATDTFPSFFRSVAGGGDCIFRSVLGGGGDDDGEQTKRNHSSSCCYNDRNAAASIWHVILPTVNEEVQKRSSVFYHHNNHLNETRGEGSWNVAWDARPARWLHNLDSAWWLFGVCAAPHLPALLDLADVDSVRTVTEKVDVAEKLEVIQGSYFDHQDTSKFKVTAVPADGRCLFRAIAQVACLRRGEEASDDNRQRELADELRAQVVDELVRRREEAEWYIEGDFDAYIENIEKPYEWGGEPELLMASHVIKTPISVYMIDRSSGNIINIANYGEEYKKDETKPINVVFHGYGHYDILEVTSNDDIAE